mgnify:CR=1 FL=1
MNEYIVTFETFSLEFGIRKKAEKVFANNYICAQKIIEEKYMVTKIIGVKKIDK